MALAEIIFTQLATRIPKDLHREVKQQCVADDTSVMAFVTAALQQFLAQRKSRSKKSA